MTDGLVLVAGLALVLAVLADAVATTVSVGTKEGWLSRALTRTLWRGFLWTGRSRRVPSLLAPAGVLLLTATVVTWVGLLWLGTVLVLLSGDAAVVDAQTGAPADAAELVYYAGFTISTLGIGDYVATSDAWRTFTAASSFAGLVLITLSITYLLSVVGAVVDRRSLAAHVHGLGRTPQQIVVGGWDGAGFSSPFQQHLVALASEISGLAEKHLAYPVLQYFHTGSPETAAPVALAALDDALLLLQSALAPDARPPASATGPVRYAIERHLSTTTGHTDVDPHAAPPVPDTAELAAAGIPLADPHRFAQTVADGASRRAHLHAFVVESGWQRAAA